MRLAAVAWLCASGGRGADWKAFRPQGYVSDFAGAVDSGSRRELDNYCHAVEQATGAHLSLVVIDSLQKEPVDAVARTIFDSWAAGKPAPENRALLLVAVANRRDSLVVGSGLQSILNSDAVDEAMSQARPALGRKQYGAALMAAAEEMGSRIAVARGKTLGVKLPQRARRTLWGAVPWPLVAGGVPILALLVWLLRRPHHRPPPGAAPAGPSTPPQEQA